MRYEADCHEATVVALEIPLALRCSKSAGDGCTELVLFNVGDGLSAQYWNNDEGIQLDAGGGLAAAELTKNTIIPMRQTQNLAISHYHLDHYCTLHQFAELELPLWDFKNLYLPPLPGNDPEFLASFFITQYVVLGSKSGNFEIDLIRLVNKVHPDRQFEVHRVFQGDEIPLGDRKLKVIWPPASLQADNGIRNTVKSILKSYQDAIKEVPQMAAITKHYASYVAQTYPGAAEFTTEGIDPNPKPIDWNAIMAELSQFGKNGAFVKKMQPILKKMRNVANEISLALSDVNRLLFFSDQESNNIEQIVHYLESQGVRRVDCMVTPHHGTHWHDSLLRLSCLISASANGAQRQRKYHADKWSSISWATVQTHTDGNFIARLPYEIRKQKNSR